MVSKNQNSEKKAKFPPNSSSDQLAALGIGLSMFFFGIDKAGIVGTPYLFVFGGIALIVIATIPNWWPKRS
jgi:hypothetical protein